MKDVAEMRYVQNFVTLTPTVAMNAQVSERVDIDELTAGWRMCSSKKWRREQRGYFDG